MLSPDSEADRVALHRYAVIAEALPERLSRAERGVLIRMIAMRTHGHPDGSERRYSRGTVDRWVRDYRRSGLAGLTPQTRSDAGKVRAHPELADVVGALRIELPTRSSVQIADMVWHRFNVRIAPRTVREQLRRQGLHRGALLADPKVFGRFEAEAPNKRWITDVLVGPYVPYPKTDTSVRARLFLIVDDHSRLLVHGRFHAFENTRAGQDVFRQAILRHGLPEVFYADNGAPFANAALARTCAILGVRLVHSKPYAPQGRGKQERLNRYIRDRFLNEATHQGIESLEQLNDLFEAWTTQVCNIRVHSETNERPIDRFQAGPPVRHPDPARLVDAFRWAATRKVTKTATISMEGNNYVVDPALVGRRIEVRFDPENLALLDVYFQGKPAGIATPFKIGRHVAKTVPQAARPTPEATGIDYLGAVHAAHEQDTIGTIHYRDMPLINIPLPYFQDNDNDNGNDNDNPAIDESNGNGNGNDFGGRS
jgi:putative transposase